MNACRSCGAPIRWATTSKGKSMPLDLTPDPSGNVVLHNDGTCSVAPPGLPLRGHVATYTSHFATCPNARQHRKPKGPA